MIGEWMPRCIEVLAGAYFLGFGVANGRSVIGIIESLDTREFPMVWLLF